jgi:hypothetical protein
LANQQHSNEQKSHHWNQNSETRSSLRVFVLSYINRSSFLFYFLNNFFFFFGVISFISRIFHILFYNSRKCFNQHIVLSFVKMWFIIILFILFLRSEFTGDAFYFIYCVIRKRCIFENKIISSSDFVNDEFSFRKNGIPNPILYDFNSFDTSIFYWNSVGGEKCPIKLDDSFVCYNPYIIIPIKNIINYFDKHQKNKYFQYIKGEDLFE